MQQVVAMDVILCCFYLLALLLVIIKIIIVLITITAIDSNIMATTQTTVVLLLPLVPLGHRQLRLELQMTQDANPNVHILHFLPHRLDRSLDPDERRGVRHPPALVLDGLLRSVVTVGELGELLVLLAHRRRQVGVPSAEEFQPFLGIAVQLEGLGVLAAVEDRVLLGQEALLDGGDVAGNVVEALFDVGGGRGVLQGIAKLGGLGGGGPPAGIGGVREHG
mmetsp:Transcript_16864/g.48450  ORF Transcript_16864/g.48450 Transcript_16864/m.48450 type:complete len:221 (-) Transcript_16864:3191-3853(-)